MILFGGLSMQVDFTYTERYTPPSEHTCSWQCCAPPLWEQLSCHVVVRCCVASFALIYCSGSGRDVALYALGVGAQGADACNPTELPFLYHPDGQSSIKVRVFFG
jgi:hypothetical protein